MAARVWALSFALAACGLVGPMAAAAQPPSVAPPASASPTAQDEPAAVSAFNRDVAVFRAPFLGVSASSRALRAQRRVSDLLDRPGAGVVSVRPEPQGHAVLVDGEIALLLTPGDVDAAHGETLEQDSRAAAAMLQRVIGETRELRDRSRLLRAVGLTLMMTAGYAFAAWLTWRMRTAFTDRLAGMLQTRTAAIRLGGTQLLDSQHLLRIAGGTVRAMSTLIVVLLLYRWLSDVLGEFPYTRPWSEGLDGFLLGVARRVGGGILRALPDLVIVAVILVLARGVIAVMAPFFNRVEQGGAAFGGLDADTARPTRRLFNIAVWLFAVAMAYPYIPGSQSEAFKGISVLVGLMLTVGGSGLLGQAASGLILMYSRTVRVGEYVRISDQEGTITELGAFATRIRTGLGEELTLPNALVLGNVTKNYSRTVKGRGYILDTVVTIGYDTPWRQVEAMLVEAARRTPGVLSSPAPTVFQTGLKDFYPEYRLVCTAIPTQPRPRAEVLSLLHGRIQDVFNEFGVQIMSPNYEADPEQPKLVGRDRWFAAPARASASPEATDTSGPRAGS